MASFANRVRDESGVTLVMALVVMAALAAGVTTTMTFSASAQRTAVRSTAEQQAYAYAEAGINSAMATLHASGANALDGSTLPPPPPDPGARRDDYGTGYVLWGGTLDSTTLKWSITSIGYAPDPASPGMPDRTRELTAVSQVVPSLTQPLNNQVWNYIYSTSKAGSDVCDVTVANNATLSAPIYAEGNLCLSPNAHVTEPVNDPPTPISVVVKGKLQISNNASVGASKTQPITEAHIAGGCGSSLSNVHPCDPSSPVDDPVWAKTLDSSSPPITPPTPDWTGWYSAATVGPDAPCLSATALNPPTFDNDGVLDLTTNGSAGTLDLTPTWSYTCQTAYGELSWNAATRVLTVKGVIYFDGNAVVSNGLVNEYDGQATLYLTGTFTMVNNSMMCGKRNAAGTDCDFDGATGWDPNTEMLIVVAHGKDAYSNSVVLNNNTRWEGGIYSQNNLDLVNNAKVEGPMILGGFMVTNNVTAVPFPVIDTVPLGAPGNPNVYADATTPTVLG